MKRFISALLALFTIAALICVPVVAADDSATTTEPSGNWTDYTTTTAFEGEGTDTKPYLIKSADDLAYLAKSVNGDGTTDSGQAYAGMYFKQTADIDLSAHYWIPIGNGQSGWAKFQGIYDGDDQFCTTDYLLCGEFI